MWVPSRGRLGFLGDASLSPGGALQQALQAEGMTGNPDFSNDAWVSAATADVSAGGISPAAFSPNCVSQPAPNINLFQTASGLALGTTSATVGILASTTVISTATAALAGAFTMGAGAIIAVIGLIFAHHAAAVKQEQQLGCAAIAAANNSIQLINAAVANGQATPQDASTALSTLVTQIQSYMSPSIKHNPCNADCEVLTIYKAIVIYQQSVFASMAAQAAANATDYAAQQSESGNTPVSSLTSPTAPVSAASGTTSSGASTATVTTDPAAVTAAQNQVTSLTQQLTTAQNQGNASLVSSLQAQLAAAQAQLAALAAPQANPNFTLQDIPVWGWALIALGAFWAFA
jgi:hypothetical protein